MLFSDTPLITPYYATYAIRHFLSLILLPHYHFLFDTLMPSFRLPPPLFLRLLRERCFFAIRDMPPPLPIDIFSTLIGYVIDMIYTILLS